MFPVSSVVDVSTHSDAKMSWINQEDSSICPADSGIVWAFSVLHHLWLGVSASIFEAITWDAPPHSEEVYFVTSFFQYSFDLSSFVKNWPFILNCTRVNYKCSSKWKNTEKFILFHCIQSLCLSIQYLATKTTSKWNLYYKAAVHYVLRSLDYIRSCTPLQLLGAPLSGTVL